MRFAAPLVVQLYRNVCSDCLARELGLTIGDADDVSRDLSLGGRFVREWGICDRCHDDDVVLRHVPSAPLGAVAF
jgi:hypothetical protein